MDYNFRCDIIDIFEDLISYKMSPKNREKVVRLSGTVEERMKTIEEYLK